MLSYISCVTKLKPIGRSLFRCVVILFIEMRELWERARREDDGGTRINNTLSADCTDSLSPLSPTYYLTQCLLCCNMLLLCRHPSYATLLLLSLSLSVVLCHYFYDFSSSRMNEEWTFCDLYRMVALSLSNDIHRRNSWFTYSGTTDGKERY